jgi:predicted esterase
MCGGIPGDWETSAAYKTTNAAVFHLAGEQDEFYPPSRISNYARQLRERAASVTFKSYDAGHEIIPAMRQDVQHWLMETAKSDA